MALRIIVNDVYMPNQERGQIHFGDESALNCGELKAIRVRGHSVFASIILNII